eukprot:9281928-Pyramimonas_sp.AAC.1
MATTTTTTTTTPTAGRTIDADNDDGGGEIATGVAAAWSDTARATAGVPITRGGRAYTSVGDQ